MEKPQFVDDKEKEKFVSETEIYPIVNTQLQERYNRIAMKWNGQAYEGTRRDDLIPQLIKLADVKDGHRILEAMCGTALLTEELVNSFPECEYYSLDFSRGMLNAINVPTKKIEASIIATPFANESFDRIFIRSAIYDIPRGMQIKALKEINRILIDGGTFILQTYHSDDQTNKALNDLVNLKDLASGQYLDMGQEYPRYFAKVDELEEWFDQSGFTFERVDNFEGKITYMKTTEMTNLGTSMWLDYVENLSDEVKKSLSINKDDNGTVSFNFPGGIYKLSKRK